MVHSFIVENNIVPSCFNGLIRLLFQDVAILSFIIQDIGSHRSQWEMITNTSRDIYWRSDMTLGAIS